MFLDGLGTESLPDPTTAGDFCRRFDAASIIALQEAVNRARLKVWRRQPEAFFEQPAVIDADASIVPTDAETKQGMDIAYNGIWGYSALLVSLANTKEPLYLGLLGANRPSHEGVIDYYDRAIALCRQAGFHEIRLRGDTDFSLTTEFDRWDDDGVRFVFGYDAKANLIEKAQSSDEEIYHELVTRAERQIATTPRARPRNVKDEIVRERNYKMLRQAAEDVVEFSYRPGNCKRDYRVVALRKNISVERGENVLFCEYRYFFYITNDWDMTADEVIDQARQRCNQENLISQLKSGVRALHAPVNTLHANWAYMTMAALAWSLKAWCALRLPVTPRWAEPTTSNAGACSPWTSAPSSPPSSTSPAKSSPPADAYAGASSPTTHGSQRSSACSTPSNTPSNHYNTTRPEPSPPATPAGAPQPPRTTPRSRHQTPTHTKREPDRHPHPLLNPQQPRWKPHRIDPAPRPSHAHPGSLVLGLAASSPSARPRLSNRRPLKLRRELARLAEPIAKLRDGRPGAARAPPGTR